MTAFFPSLLRADEAPVTPTGGMPPDDPLTAYVTRPDASYRWEERRRGNFGRVEFIELRLTSQTWQGGDWKHQLFVLKPSQVDHARQGLMLIGGGRWTAALNGPPAADNSDLPREALALVGLVESLQSPMAILMQVPHQPLFDGMVEDQLIAYTFDRYLQTGDAQWPLLFPMVKSAVRAMDAVQELARREWNLEIENFTLSGASKRGWTTWLAAAVDSRVNALAPMVIDMLNTERQMEHQLLSWGKFSDEIVDYTRRQLQERSQTPRGRELNRMVDPFFYRQRLLQPKLILLGTNDRYWTLDALNLYWPELEGPKHVLYVPNNGHGLRDLPRVIGAVSALHRSVLGLAPLPQMQWSLEAAEQLSLRLQSDAEPQRVVAWAAESPTRDFRNAEWKSVELQRDGDAWTFARPAPATGFAAIFGEMMFPGSPLPLYLSTNVQIAGGAQAKVSGAAGSTPAGSAPAGSIPAGERAAAE